MFPKKPLESALDTYYATLATYAKHGDTKETTTRTAMLTLLDTLAQTMKWSFVAEYPVGKNKRIDGAVRDSMGLPRGYWEAKDTRDNLEVEIQKKRRDGYPTTNTIFEDTRRAILYQDKEYKGEYTITQREELIALLERFFSHTKDQIELFQREVATFQTYVPKLAKGLMEHIHTEKQENPAFIAKFDEFLKICRASINPNIRTDAVEEMLVQHILTERILRTVFNLSDFDNRNPIANEIESVIHALTSRAFSRDEFLGDLANFYKAVEDAAKTIDDFGEKQMFLNELYKRFFQSYAPKDADRYGIIYTPVEIVDFMCASVDGLLKEHFDTSLSEARVCMLDPCVGTGNYVVNIIGRIDSLDIDYKYDHEIFCNEVMLLPYYIASLNIEYAYKERTGRYRPFNGIAFVDTLDIDVERHRTMFSEKNAERIARQQQADITVIIGNPPYNVGQINENDNNKNRVYPSVDGHIKETYSKDSQATLNNQLYDMYVKFFRWATDRLGDRDGIVCFVSNNGFLDGIAFDGFRKHIAQDFTHIYHLNLGGNARKNGGGSVFNIMVGVGITMLVRKGSSKQPSTIRYHAVDETLSGKEKLALLKQWKNYCAIDWKPLHPNEEYTWLTEGLRPEFKTFLPIGTKEAKAARDTDVLFKMYSNGVHTCRDTWVYNYQRDVLTSNVRRFIAAYNNEVNRWRDHKGEKHVDEFVLYDDKKIKWSRDLKRALSRQRYTHFDNGNVRVALYRPYSRQYLYLDIPLVDVPGKFLRIFPIPKTETKNKVICVAGLGNRQEFGCLASNAIINFDFAFEKTQCFPFYTYDLDGTNRKENITDWALQQFQARCGSHVTKWDIFYYIYALLHHPTYRERYAVNLRRELPRLPLPYSGEKPTGTEALAILAAHGKSLADLHIGYEQVAEYRALKSQRTEGRPVSWRVEKMKLSQDKKSIIVNPTLALHGIPPECFDYRLGNRSALEWVIDQYQVKTDKRSGIVNDPNREDDPEYIVRLVRRVVTVSVETVKIVKEIAKVDLGGGRDGVW